MMRVIEKGYIQVTDQGESFRSKTFPAFEKLSSGRWLAGFKAAEKKGDCDFKQAVITWSDDEGKSWVKPFEPVKLPDINGIPGQSQCLYFLALDGDKILMMINWVDSSDTSKPYYNPENESLKDTRIFFSFSEDGGATWSTPQWMDISEANGPVPLTGPPIRMGDGTIACQFEINKYDWDPNKWIHRSAMIFSKDEGKTWADMVWVTNKPMMYYWDQRPNVLANGQTVINYFWTLDGHRQQYLNIHAAVSKDSGKTWSDPWDTGVYGQPGRPVELLDGRLATIDVDRSVSPVVTVRLTKDLGHSYEEGLVIYQSDLVKQDSRTIGMNEAWDEMARFSVGHPNLLYLSKKEILAYFYAGEHTDNTEIVFMRILMD